MEYFNRHGHYPINVEPALPQWDDCSLNIDERLAALRRVGKQFDPFQLCEYKYTEDYKWKLKALLNIKNDKPMEFPDLPIDQVNLEFDIEDYPEIFKDYQENKEQFFIDFCIDEYYNKYSEDKPVNSMYFNCSMGDEDLDLEEVIRDMEIYFPNTYHKLQVSVDVSG